MTTFVNPYTFVPHVTPEREKPAGHAVMGPGRLSGILKLTLRVRTPLVIGGQTDPETGTQLVPRRGTNDRTAMVPGSGLLGAVRSVHEALAGGCLRVLNADWVPAHRHPANVSETRDLRLAVVTQVDDQGAAVGVAVCDDWMMVPAELLPGGEDDLPATGDQLVYAPDGVHTAPFPRSAVTEANGRPVLHALRDAHEDGVPLGSIIRARTMGPVTGECWVLLVTDTKARSAKHPLRFAAGRTGPGAPSYTVTPAAWTRYEEAVAGADDLRPAALPAAGAAGRGQIRAIPAGEPPFDPRNPEYAAVPPPGGGAAIAQRLRARTYLHVGQPVWVRVDEAAGEVTEIRLSVLWRYLGDGTAGERAGAARPCTDPGSLCWSCRVFGSADTGGRGEDDLAVQHGYRGHVRFDDLLARRDFTAPRWHLAPLSSPGPSAGQFYLDNSGVPASKRLSARDTRPAATWGSEADRPQRRPIRGRKFYWRTDADPLQEEQPRGRFRDHQAEKLAKWVELVPAGTVFTGRVRFDNLTAADYGSLLAALDPRLLAAADDQRWRDTVTSVGGGKPFGFGAVSIDVEPELVQTARMRYLGEEGAVSEAADAVHEFCATVPRRVREEWKRLRPVLTFGHVRNDLVVYPPGSGEKGSKGYDESFEFFALTRGVEMTTGDRVLLALPDPADGPRAQEIKAPARDENRGSQEPRDLHGSRDRHDGDRRGGQGQQGRRDRRGGRG